MSGFIGFIVLCASIGIGLFTMRFVFSVFSGTWKNGGVKIAQTVRKFAKGYCIFLFAVFALFTLYCLIGLFSYELEFLGFLLIVAIAFACVAATCALTLFVTEMEAARFEAQLETAINTKKMYKVMSGATYDEVEAETEAEAVAEAQKATGEWYCEKCRNLNKAQSVFCMNCGAHR